MLSGLARSFLRMAMALGIVVVILACTLPAALAASRGDNNAGDVFVRATGTGAGPGHATEPHLGCNGADIYGAGMADAGGTFTITAAPPTGTAVVYQGNWTYNTAAGGVQLIARVPYATLIAGAAAAGPASNHGYHLRLTVNQDPVKHKMFWIGCAAPAPTPSGGVQGVTTPPASGSGAGSSPEVVVTGVRHAAAVEALHEIAAEVAAVTATKPFGGVLGISTSVSAPTSGNGAATTAPSGGVEAASAGESTPSTASGVLGAATGATTPLAGAELPAAGLRLMALGLLLISGFGIASLRRRAVPRTHKDN